MNACVGYKQSRIVVYSGCRCSALVCIDQVFVRVICSLNHFVSISPSIRGQSVVVNMVLLLGDMAAFISCVGSTRSEYNDIGEEKKGFAIFF